MLCVVYFITKIFEYVGLIQIEGSNNSVDLPKENY